MRGITFDPTRMRKEIPQRIQTDQGME